PVAEAGPGLAPLVLRREVVAHEEHRPREPRHAVAVEPLLERPRCRREEWHPARPAGLRRTLVAPAHVELRLLAEPHVLDAEPPELTRPEPRVDRDGVRDALLSREGLRGLDRLDLLEREERPGLALLRHLRHAHADRRIHRHLAGLVRVRERDRERAEPVPQRALRDGLADAPPALRLLAGHPPEPPVDVPGLEPPEEDPVDL